MPRLSNALALCLSFASLTGLSACYAQTGEAAASSPQKDLPPSEAGLRQIPLHIQTAKARHDFVVEVAGTVAEQAKGLMFRTHLAADRGMIFPFPEDRMASFWMKNTVIPLDIIFIRRDGTIESIAADTPPYSLASVLSGEPVATVLEIPAGRSAELGIEPGDTVTWR